MEDLFESRLEIERLMLILNEWKTEHPNDSKKEYAEELFKKLDILHMTW